MEIDQKSGLLLLLLHFTLFFSVSLSSRVPGHYKCNIRGLEFPLFQCAGFRSTKVKCTTHLDLDNRCRRGPQIFAGSSLSLFPYFLCDCKYLCTFELSVRKEFHGVTSGSGNQGFNCLDQFIEDHHCVLSSRCVGEWGGKNDFKKLPLSLNAPEPSDISWEWLWVCTRFKPVLIWFADVFTCFQAWMLLLL